MALDKIESNGQDNQTWRNVIDGGINLLNSDVLQANTTVTITQSGNGSTTVCEVSGHTSATFNASDYNNLATETIQAAINSIPKNLSGHTLDFVFGTSSGETIELESQIYFYDFVGGDVEIKSALQSDNESNNTGTKVNKIQSVDHPTSGDIIDRLFSINNCSEVIVMGLHLRYLSANTNKWIVTNTANINVDYAFCFVEGNGQVGLRGVYYQRGGQGMVRGCKFADMAYGIQAVAGAVVNAQGNSYDSGLGNQPTYGHSVTGAIITPNSSHVTGNTADYLASQGGLITNEDGLILEETVLQASKVVNLDNSMSVTKIQDIINDQPKQLNGYQLIFQFADGEYDFLSGGISFHGFDGGYLDVRGNTNDTLAADGTGLSVKFKGDQGSNSGLVVFVNCSARCHIQHIAFEQDSTSVTDQRLLRFYSVAHGLVNYCSFNSLSTNRANEGIVLNDGRTRINHCKFNNLDIAIYSIQATTHSNDNAEFSGGTAPNTGLYSINGSIITQQNTQVNAHINDASKSGGGVIFNSSGQPIS